MKRTAMLTRSALLSASVLLAVVVAFAAALTVPMVAQEQQEPNIIYLFTDDNSERVFWPAMDAMQNRIGGEGLTFENATFAQSLCCPNRASMQRGQYPHNTGVHTNSLPDGGYATFHDRASTWTPWPPRSTPGLPHRLLWQVHDGYGGSFFGSVPRGWDTWLLGSHGRKMLLEQRGKGLRR